MEKLYLGLILFGCLAMVLSTPGMYGYGGDGMMGGDMMGGGMMGGGMMGGDMMGGGMMYGGMMDADMMGGSYIYGMRGMRGYGGRHRRCRCRKSCRRWERYMGKCWKCRWWNCRAYCCRY